MKKFTVATMTTILGEMMKSRLEIIKAENAEKAIEIYSERHPRISADKIVVEEYRF